MAIALVYDPRYHTWDSWSSLMCEAYAAQSLSINAPEEAWADWAAGLLAIDVFVNEGIPAPYIYENWQDWAQALVGAVNQNIQETAT